MPAARQLTREYKPGEMAPISGIYRVFHGTGHREPHTVVVIRGEQFPPCRTCKHEVSFSVTRQSSHLTHDWDFTGPASLTIGKPAAPSERPLWRPSQIRELRSANRFPWRLPLIVKLPWKRQTEHSFTRDISTAGLFFYHHSSLESGTSVECTLAMPLDNPFAAAQRVRYRGKVVRVEALPSGVFGVAIAARSQPSPLPAD